MEEHQENNKLLSHLTHLNGAAIIDKNNREIPITETMIKDALERLDSSKPKSN
jgi:hypothetical protein